MLHRYERPRPADSAVLDAVQRGVRLSFAMPDDDGAAHDYQMRRRDDLDALPLPATQEALRQATGRLYASSATRWGYSHALRSKRQPS